MYALTKNARSQIDCENQDYRHRQSIGCTKYCWLDSSIMERQQRKEDTTLVPRCVTIIIVVVIIAISIIIATIIIVVTIMMMMMMLGVSANQVGLADLCSAAAKEEFTSLSSNDRDDDK